MRTNLHTSFGPGALVGRSRESRRRTPGTDERVIAGMFPAASIPDAVLSDDPARFRAAIVESSNPVHSLPDSARMREAIAALKLSVVIDITMTETAMCADYVLPALTQYEKYECTFGYGLQHGPGGPVTGVAPNELTDASGRDWLVGTPWHKHVTARVEKASA